MGSVDRIITRRLDEVFGDVGSGMSSREEFFEKFGSSVQNAASSLSLIAGLFMLLVN